GSHKKVIWRCKKGHEWEAVVKSRTINKTGCPYCSHNKVLAGFNDLATLLPDIAAEWSDRNYPLPEKHRIYSDELLELRRVLHRTSF
ncbi:MAG: zinc-ribbon domain-containing protein, partial [Mediterraneibacter gnavus]